MTLCNRRTNNILHVVLPKAESLDGALCVPDIKLHSNPSAFNVYCNVRHCVLDWQQREASLALASRSSVQSGDSDSEEEEEYREPAVKLPKVRAGGSLAALVVEAVRNVMAKASLVFLCWKKHFSPRGPQEGLCLYVVVIIGVIALTILKSPACKFYSLRSVPSSLFSL